MKHYIIAYDITSQKRAYKVRKILYEYTFGGQKSVLEMILSKADLEELIDRLKSLLKKRDRVNIVEIYNDISVYGKTDILSYDRGVIII